MEKKTRRIIITNSKTHEQWITELKPKPDDDDEGQFVAAYFKKPGSDEEEPMEATNDLTIINCNEINRKKMKDAFENQSPPMAPQAVERLEIIRNRQYCLPYFYPDGRLAGYRCYGVGPYSCAW